MINLNIFIAIFLWLISMVYKIIVSYKLFINVRNFIFNISHENRIEYYQSVVNAALVRHYHLILSR